MNGLIVSKLKVGVSVRACVVIWFTALGFAAPRQANAASTTVSITSFGARANQSNYNCREALQAALSSLTREGGGVLTFPAGDFFLDFPDIANDIYWRDVDGHSLMAQKKLSKEKLILVPSNIKIVGASDKAGNLSTHIHWKETSFPLFSFVNSDRSGIANIAFVFDGVQPHFFPWSQEDYLSAVEVGGGGIGGPFDLSAVIYTIGSENLIFENLSFDSSKKPADNEHSFFLGIIAHGKSMTVPVRKGQVANLSMDKEMFAGGLSACAVGNQFRHLTFSSFITGITLTAQCNAVIENISGNRRASWFRSFDPAREQNGSMGFIGPPGHLIYIATQSMAFVKRTAEHPEGDFTARDNMCKDITIRNISEGSDTLSNVNSAGTLALKAIEGGTVENVQSQHPAGLIQFISDAHNLSLTNLQWTSQRDLCSETGPPLACHLPVIGLLTADHGSGNQTLSGINDHITFREVTLTSPHFAALVKVSGSNGPLSNNILVQNLKIQCPPNVKNGEKLTAIVTVMATDSHLTDVEYLPVVDSWSPKAILDIPAAIWPRSANTTIDLTVHRLRGSVPDDAQVYQSNVSPDAAKNGCSITKRFAP